MYKNMYNYMDLDYHKLQITKYSLHVMRSLPMGR